MATSFPRPDGSGEGGGGDKTQAIPKMLLAWLIIGVIAVIIVTAVVIKHNAGKTSAGMAGQPADRATGPQLGSEGPANGRSLPAGMASGTAATGQGGGPSAMGTGAGVGKSSPGTAGARTGGVSSGAPSGPSAGTAGTVP
ncbi:MAG: hypothetical protein M3Y13_12310 [Armatimonadota bacterium]|nr:hypothetical protein [Armatimonadota bacterium]